jgi:hypothetical protein
MLLTCIKCGVETELQLCLQMRPEAGVCENDGMYCPECEDDFKLTEVEKMLNDWQRLLDWVKLCPARQPQTDPRDVPAPDPIADRIIRSVRGD